MRTHLWIIILLGISLPASAQLWDLPAIKNDSFPQINFKSVLVSRYCFYKDTVISNSEELNRLKARCPELEDTFDFSRDIFLTRYEGGDCHARYKHDIHLDTRRQKLVWVIYNYYGGCRAGGGRSFFFVVPKPPAGYTVEMRTVLVDRHHEMWEKE